MKRMTIFLLACGLVLTLSASASAGAPASQFGFSGWPYRNETSCTGTCDQQCSQCESNDDCCTCPVCCVTSKPTAEPAPTATAHPTDAVKPTVTPAATAHPTEAVKPTSTPAATAVPQPTKTPYPTSTVDYTTNSPVTQEQKALNLLNADRAANGLPTLVLDSELSRLARLKSCDMNANNYFAHISPTYGSASDLLKANGYSFTSVGENIAHHATVEKAEAAFMSSTGHRTNILGSQWTKVGIGVCVDDQGFVYVTQLFVR